MAHERSSNVYIPNLITIFNLFLVHRNNIHHEEWQCSYTRECVYNFFALDVTLIMDQIATNFLLCQLFCEILKSNDFNIMCNEYQSFIYSVRVMIELLRYLKFETKWGIHFAQYYQLSHVWLKAIQFYSHIFDGSIHFRWIWKEAHNLDNP